MFDRLELKQPFRYSKRKRSYLEAFTKRFSQSWFCCTGLRFSRCVHAGKLYAKTLHLPLGLQLYSVRELLPKITRHAQRDRRSGLSRGGVSRLLQSQRGRSEAGDGERRFETRQRALLLRTICIKQFDQILAFNKELGVSYIICSSPGSKIRTAQTADQGQCFHA